MLRPASSSGWRSRASPTVENVAGDLLGIVKGQVHGDLERFKQLVEHGDQESGAWRGEVQDGETK